jgi:hypothetical protein
MIMKTTRRKQSDPLEAKRSVGFMKAHGQTARTHGADRMASLHKQLKVATYNVRTLYQSGKFHQLCTGCKSVGIDLASIQEHRWTTESEVDFQWHSDGDYMLAYSSASQQRTGGVGLLIHKKHANALKSACRVSKRILVAKFNSNPELNIICVHAPTESATQVDKNAFYSDLKNCV